MTNSKINPPKIAVVGVSALFPGSIDTDGFWSDILSGKDLLTDIPETHWLIDDYYDADPSAPDKTYAKRGGFLDFVEFDPMKFGMPPNIAPATDTAQMLSLIVAQRVLEDACGGQFAEVDKEKCSIILGVTSAQELLGTMISRLQRPVWVKGLRDAGIEESKVQEVCDRIAGEYQPWQESSFPGLLGNVVAGRIANRLDLGGTNCVTDAACASSLSALSMAVNELTLGQSDMVITGGVDTMNDIFMYMCFSKTPALSQSGDCRPFSDKADGTMLSEGIGMIALKRLEDAERDGDRIYSVITGVGSSSDGRAKSVYAPRAEGQVKAIDRAYELTGYSTETVELVEAHGTGTKAGDLAEFSGLQMAFTPEDTSKKQWCALGSVKSQIGHAKAAAGAAGLFKAIMALHHKVLPPTIKVDQPNPKLKIDESPFYLNTTSRPWVRSSEHPRRASVSSFGFGGSNFHVALEEYVGEGKKAWRKQTHSSELVLLSGGDAATLLGKLQSVTIEGADFLKWFARASQKSFNSNDQARLSIVASTDGELAEKIQMAIQWLSTRPTESFSQPTGIEYRTGKSDPGEIGFLFPGQGSQYLNMGADLSMHWDKALDAWDLAASNDFNAEQSLADVVFPKRAFDQEEKATQETTLRSTQWAQPAIGVASLAQMNLLQEIGLKPDAVAGHSFGELVALHAAGAIDAAAMIKIARRRGELMAEAASVPGAMTAVVCGGDKVQSILDESGTSVVVANYNSHRQTVISGTVEGIDAVEELLGQQQLKFTRLSVATAFHSEVVSGSSKPFGAFLKKIPFKKPSLPVYSNSFAKPYPKTSGNMRVILGEQLSKPVHFVTQIEAMYEAGIRTFIEVGPNAVLTNLVGQILDGKEHLAINLDRKGKNGITSFWNGIAKLAVEGVALDLAPLWAAFDERVDPASISQPAMVLRINGANSGKIYPPLEGSIALPAPNPEREPEVVVKEVIKEVVKEVRVEVPVPTSARSAAAPMMLNDTGVAHPESNAMNPAFDMTPLLEVYRDVQDQTAQTHSLWQKSMADTHQSFLASMESTLAQLGAMASGQAPTPVISDYSIPAPVMAPSISEPRKVAAPIFTPIPEPIAAVPEPTVVEETPAVMNPPTETPIIEEVQALATPALNVKELMLEVVAEKTGYPVEMLQMEMSLEADLGIDSIKRVEILSALTEKAPGLPEPDNTAMSGLQTVGEIVHYLEGLLGDVPAPVAGAPKASPGINIKQLMLDVVAEKTGYPVEMLAMEMSLEADLGIDSIKRVEILSALTEKAPGMPEPDNTAMSGLQTVGEIVDYLDALLGTVATVSTPAPAVGIDIKQLMLEVVAEKTGYPVEMLKLEMSLEADLGIDSIKRVEILSALTEKAPGMPEPDNTAMSGLQTVGEIVDYLDSLLGTTTSAPSSSPAVDVDIKQLMLEVVSDKTGYPVEMLKLEMSLEADLGIDSIKRVEILSALTEKAPGMPEPDNTAMSGLQTVGEIVDYLDNLLAGGTESSLQEEVQEPIEVGAEPVRRYTLKAIACSESGFAMKGLFEAKSVALTKDDFGVGPKLAKILQSRGINANVVDVVDETHDGVIFLEGLTKSKKVDELLAINQSAFETAKAVSKRLTERGGLFVTVQSTGGQFGLSGIENAWTAGLSGLVKTASHEWPKASLKAIDVESIAKRSSTEIAEALGKELCAGGPGIEVGLCSDGQRYRLESVAEVIENTTGSISSDSVMVVSGGGRGVTAATMIALAKESKARFALLGRTKQEKVPEVCDGIDDSAELKRVLLGEAKKKGEAITPKELGNKVKTILAIREIEATLEAIVKVGGEATYYAVDVSDAKGVAATLKMVRKQWGPITGIIHGAGVLADKLIADKTVEEFTRVFDTKIKGLRALLDATVKDPIAHLVFFSSVAARAGNRGQCDYAMANEVLNKIAAQEAQARGEKCVVKSFNWGPWAGGMVTPELKRQFEARGIPLIPIDEGAARLVAELLSEDSTNLEITIGGKPTLSATEKAKDEDEFHIMVNSSSHGFLKDHCVNDIPVVPVVLVMEWFMRAAKAMRPDLYPVACQNVKVLKGILLKEFDSTIVMIIKVNHQGDSKSSNIAMECVSQNGTRHYCASVLMADKVLTIKAKEKADLEFKGFQSDIYDGEVLFHGPQFQMLQKVDGVEDEGSSGQLIGTEGLGWSGTGWQTDVGAIDGGLQLALLWSKHVLGGRTLPTGVGTYNDYGKGLFKEPVTCELEKKNVSRNKAVCDITFSLGNGDVLAKLTDVETHLIPESN